MFINIFVPIFSVFTFFINSEIKKLKIRISHSHFHLLMPFRFFYLSFALCLYLSVKHDFLWICRVLFNCCHCCLSYQGKSSQIYIQSIRKELIEKLKRENNNEFNKEAFLKHDDEKKYIYL